MPPKRSGRVRTNFSTRSTYTGNFSSLPYAKPARYECVICGKRYKIKNGVKRHFNKHPTIPHNDAIDQQLPAFTHPSCWLETEVFRWERQQHTTDLKQDRLSNHPESYGIEDDMVELGAVNKDEVEPRKELKVLRQWWWWWNATGDDNITSDFNIQQAIQNAPAGPLRVVGPAGDKKGPPPETWQDEPKTRAANDHPQSENGLAEASFVSTVGEMPEARALLYFPRERPRAKGRLITPCDLSGHQPLMRKTIQQFVGDCNIGYLRRKKENFASLAIIGAASLAFVGRLTPRSSINHSLRTHLDGRDIGDDYDRLGDREKITSAVANSIRKHFGAGRSEIPRRSQEEYDLCQAMALYADALRDTSASRRILTYRDGGDNALEQWYDQEFRPLREMDPQTSSDGTVDGQFGQFR